MDFGDAQRAGSSPSAPVPEAGPPAVFDYRCRGGRLAHYAVTIESTTDALMDIEWGRDGVDGKLYILQARPETVKSREDANTLCRFRLKSTSKVLASGRAIGQKVGQGAVRLVKSAAEMDKVKAGDVLVADMTDPDWEPVMKRAAAIVTNRGGRTCHAAIIARELGIPAVVGCGDATRVLAEDAPVTVSCTEGDTGHVYEGLLEVEVVEVALDRMPAVPTKLMMNVGNAELAGGFAGPNEGVGPAARVHHQQERQDPSKALIEFDRQSPELQREIRRRIGGYATTEFYVSKIAEGVATIAAAFWPKKVIVRLSDFGRTSIPNLVGGQRYEPHEENPMLGFRGASRYIAKEFHDCFALECAAMKRVRDTMGFINVELMIPFVRTVEEAEMVIALLKEQGLERARHGLRVIMMCEIPSNAILADQFLEHFDGFSIGSNDMTQLTPPSTAMPAARSRRRSTSVRCRKAMLRMAIAAGRRAGKYAGIGGQGQSDHPDLAQWLVKQGIESMSLNPDTIVETWLLLAGKKPR